MKIVIPLYNPKATRKKHSSSAKSYFSQEKKFALVPELTLPMTFYSRGTCDCEDSATVQIEESLFIYRQGE